MNSTRLESSYSGIGFKSSLGLSTCDATITDFENEFSESSDLNSKTLVKKVTVDLKNYIKNNHKVGDKMPAHFELSNILKVSVKTVHDALKSLIDEGILLARRGRYGTTITRIPDSNVLQPTNEVSILTSSIFAKAEDAAFYSYQNSS